MFKWQWVLSLGQIVSFQTVPCMLTFQQMSVRVFGCALVRVLKPCKQHLHHHRALKHAAEITEGILLVLATLQCTLIHWLKRLWGRLI